MKQRLTALVLAGVMLLGLAACAGQRQQEPSPSASAEVTGDPSPAITDVPAETAEPTDTPILDKGTPAPVVPSQEVPVLRPGDLGYEEPAPTPSGPAIGDPTVPPSVEPTQEPSEEPAETLTAADLRNMFVLSSSNSNQPTADFTNMGEYLENFYNLSADDLEDFVFYMPDMSTALQEFFLAKAKEGKVDTVKAACQSRLDGLKEEAEFYPGTADFVDTAKVEVVGDWVVLAVCPEADRMAKILQDAVK